MAQLIVRNIDAELVRLLKVRAAGHGRSAEAEHRQILEVVLRGGGTAEDFDSFLLKIPELGEDEDFRRSPHTGRKVEI